MPLRSVGKGRGAGWGGEGLCAILLPSNITEKVSVPMSPGMGGGGWRRYLGALGFAEWTVLYFL